MFTAIQRRQVRIEHLVSAHDRHSAGKHRNIPTVMRGIEIPKVLSGTNYEAPEPCTLNVIVEKFYDREGKPKELPFVLQLGEEVVGYTGLKYKSPHGSREIFAAWNSILCVETRSRQAARRGFTCLGFYQDKQVHPFFDNAEEEINLLFRNDLPLPVEMRNPFSPAQLWMITYIHPRHKELNDNIILIDGTEEVTEKNKITWSEEPKLYTVHLGKGIKYFLPQKEPVPLEALEEVIRVGNLEDIDPSLLDFSLTITKETVATNGCPVYLFPFHHRDMYSDVLETRERIEQLFRATFVERRYMQVTANAGLSNPGSTTEIIFENCARAKTVRKSFLGSEITRDIFQEGAPFGVLMPLPFYDGGIDTRYRRNNIGIGLK